MILEQNRKDSHIGYRSGILNINIRHNVIHSEMHVFVGTNPSVWFTKLEKLFEFKIYGDELKLDIVYFCVKGEALTWFKRDA